MMIKKDQSHVEIVVHVQMVRQFLFLGEKDDNGRLNDFWGFDLKSNSWK